MERCNRSQASIRAPVGARVQTTIACRTRSPSSVHYRVNLPEFLALWTRRPPGLGSLCRAPDLTLLALSRRGHLQRPDMLSVGPVDAHISSKLRFLIGRLLLF